MSTVSEQPEVPDVPVPWYQKVWVFDGETGNPVLALDLNDGTYAPWSEELQAQLLAYEIEPEDIDRLPEGSRLLGHASPES